MNNASGAKMSCNEGDRVHLRIFPLSGGTVVHAPSVANRGYVGVQWDAGDFGFVNPHALAPHGESKPEINWEARALAAEEKVRAVGVFVDTMLDPHGQGSVVAARAASAIRGLIADDDRALDFDQ